MSDIFHEVEEEVRRERLEKLWKQYGDYAIAAVAVIVIAVAGFKFWQRYETQQRLNASSEFIAARQMAAPGNGPAAAAAFANLAKTAPKGYVAVSQLAEADALNSSNRADALTLYKKIADGNSPLAAVARIRAAWIMVEAAPRAEMESWLSPLNVQTNAWRFTAREILAFADYRIGAFGRAQSEFAALAADKDASQTVRGRAHAMADFMKAGGDKDYGSVPKPAAPAVTDNSKGQPSP